ncbi:DUF4282 domain-containing protein [Hydrogenimonas urashimensis]|uniref:DUF4282 domain-containing protein n=1 Tax=Hydrogenimonas urashimensis TaxID=2740515 RepID=UPI001916BE2C|nr:DUF4282 domain-containing protein [Hydrogenimonas urashimensis]
MKDFLTFKTFVTPDVLIFFYYLGAVVVPAALWLFRQYLVERVPFCRKSDEMAKRLFAASKPIRKTVVILLVLGLFLMTELMWRIMFETMIGYFQMHDDLHRLVEQMKK